MARLRDRSRDHFRRGLLAKQRGEIKRHLEILESLGLADGLQKSQLRRDVRGAATRRASATYTASILTTWLFSVPTVIAIAAVVLSQSEIPFNSSARMLILSYGGGIELAGGLAITPAALVILTTFFIPSLNHLFEKLTMYTMLGSASLVFLFFTIATWETGDAPVLNMNAVSTSALIMSGLLVAFSGTWAFLTWLTNYFNARWCYPYDHTVLFLLGVAASVHSRRHRWHNDSQVRGWRAGLEIVAVQVERDASLSKRIGTTEASARAELRNEARRIAAVVRSHQKSLAQAYSADDVDAVVVSLVRGLQVFCAGDRAALLANAPDQVAPRVNRFAAATLRLIPAAVLISAGFLLPLVPAIAQSELASNLRWYLITMGAIMFITTREDLTTKIGEAVAKALFK